MYKTDPLSEGNKEPFKPCFVASKHVTNFHYGMKVEPPCGSAKYIYIPGFNLFKLGTKVCDPTSKLFAAHH